MRTKSRKMKLIEDEDLALGKVRRILAGTSLIGKLANSVEFLEYLHELRVRKDNPFWIIGDEAYNIQLIQKRLMGEPVDLYAGRYYKLFREHDKRSLAGVRGEEIPGEFGKSINHYNHANKWRK